MKIMKIISFQKSVEFVSTIPLLPKIHSENLFPKFALKTHHASNHDSFYWNIIWYWSTEEQKNNFSKNPDIKRIYSYKNIAKKIPRKLVIFVKIDLLQLSGLIKIEQMPFFNGSENLYSSFREKQSRIESRCEWRSINGRVSTETWDFGPLYLGTKKLKMFLQGERHSLEASH